MKLGWEGIFLGLGFESRDVNSGECSVYCLIEKRGKRLALGVNGVYPTCNIISMANLIIAKGNVYDMQVRASRSH